MLRFLRRHRPRLIGAAFVVLALGVWLGYQAFKTEPDSLIVAEYTIAPPSWPQGLDGFRIAAVGDVHGGAPFVDEAKLEELSRRISAARPDLIVWLGDYVTQSVLFGKFMEPEKVASLLVRAQAGAGHSAVIGNHDRWLGAERIEKAFTSVGIPFLRWQSQTLEVRGERVHLFGLDDYELSPDYWGRFREAQALWAKLPPGEPLIILTHSPDVFPSLPARANLTLASHTHGGQVRLPGIGSLIVPSSFGQRYARGHIVEDGRHLFVNTGIGTSFIPIRFGVPPEISILTLRAAGPSDPS